MKIVNHRLCKDDDTPYSFKASPNHGGALQPEYLVMHFTASRDAKEAINWLCNPEAKASAHLVIARDGTVTQLVPFDTVAWHAGVSAWEGKTGLNKFSIGIELDNAGRLTRKGDHWFHWLGDKRIDDDEVTVAVHRNDKPGTPPSGWQTYSAEQLEVALAVSRVLIDRYGLREVIGHDDIAPVRKSDPGPAFPMSAFRSRLFGREEDEAATYVTTAELNIRVGPGAENATLPQSPLPQGTRVQVVAKQGSWWQVDVLDRLQGAADVQGWVHSRFLSRS